MKELIVLNDLYRKILNRDVDENGIDTYLPRLRINPKIAKFTIEQDLLSSDEYKKLGKNFDSMSGDRTSYINQDNLDILNNSVYKNVITSLIKLIVLVENPNYPLEKLENRINTVKKSLIHCGNNNLPFSIFPHLEYDFCTDRFNDSLRNFTNFQYYTMYVCVAAIWKILFGKAVSTCGTTGFVNRLMSINDQSSFTNIFDSIGIDIINYLSIRLCGRILLEEEALKAKKYITENKDSNLLIGFLNDLVAAEQNKEWNTAVSNIKDIINRTGGKKPKVLIMIAYLETQNPLFIEKMLYHIRKVKEINSLIDIDFALDNERISKEPGDYTPWSRVKRIRNLMIEKYPIKNYDYLYIIDSDIIDYPHNFLTRAIGLNPEGITAPVALIQNSVVFYDWCGYQKKGATNLYGEYRSEILIKGSQKRNFNLQPPYVEDSNRLVEIDCVGCTYVVPVKVFSQTYGNMQQELLETFEIAKVQNHKIKENIVQYEDHPSFTDHYTICAATRANSGKIIMDRGSVAYHADLPIYGEAWH